MPFVFAKSLGFSSTRQFAAAVSLILLFSAIAPISAQEPTAEQLEFFEAKVRPILVERCYECHSAKQAEPKGGLRVDSLSALLAGGETGPAVVPGKPQEGLFIDAINYGDVYQMPPKSKMPDEEIAVLTKWVEQGAPWPKEADQIPGATLKTFDLQQRKNDHWCWQPIANPPPPSVKNNAWVKQELDRFILARLEQEGLSPAPAADRRTLVRRAYFDLIGLPPTPEEMSAALADESPQGFERLVNKLLESPHFGERWGRHWLDLVRYAESRGHEFDYTAANAYQYRDYVIRALNADVPYDQFLTEHVAGDLLEKPRLHADGFNESIIATGFWYLGEWLHSPVDIRKDETDRFDNMVDVFSKTFLGVTVACARCHDHKFDAISQADYYALFGFLQSSGYRQARIDTLQQHRAIASQLAALDQKHHQQIAAAVAKTKHPVASRLADYLLAARSLMLDGVVVKPDIEGKVTRDSLDDAARAKIVAVAESKKLDGAALTHWLGHLHLATARKTDPLHAWAVIANTKDADDPQRLAALLTELGASAAPSSASSDVSLQTIVDYGKLSAGQWLTDGVAFGSGPVMPGQTLVSAAGNSPVSVATYGAARRDPFWQGLTLSPDVEKESGTLGEAVRAGQTLRTPTFELRDGRVHYLLKGPARVYAAVDSHALIQGPLHGQLLKNVTGPSLASIRWITHDLQAYKGHRAHLEFTPHENEEFELLAVVEGERPPPESTQTFPLLPQAASDVAPTLESVAQQMQQQLEKTLELLASGELPVHAEAASQSQLAAWMLTHGKLFETTGVEAADSAEQLKQQLASYAAERQKLSATVRRDSRLALAMWDGSPDDERLLIRGNTKTVGPVVPRRMLEAIDTEPMQLGSGSGRLELAQALLDRRNPLTSRVMVNRIWQHLLGRGIVPSVDNFGVLGQLPTHGDLLDHLATQFRQEGWSVKGMIRTIMLSSTYQQSSGSSGADSAEATLAAAKAATADPQNLLFHRQNMKRLEGEAIRDSILAVSGRLDRTQFGPSVPVHLTSFLQGRGRPASGPLDGNGRRSIYISVRRNFLSPMMLAFDTPIPFSTVGQRNVSNVPAQALILMNDPLVIEQARVWARSLLAVAEQTPEQRVARLYEQAFGRPPNDQETAAALAFLNQQAGEYGLSAEQAQSDERVWADLCHVLLNVKEFVFVR